MLMETQVYNFSDCGQPFFPIEWSSVEDYHISGQFCYFVTTVSDALLSHIGYISAADQFSVFVHAERLNKTKMNFSLSVHTKTDN